MQPSVPDHPPFDGRWLDELADGCRQLRGTHPRFEDLYLERRLEIRVAEGEETTTCRLAGAATRWRFSNRRAMHAAAGVSPPLISALLSRYSDRLSVPCDRPAASNDLDPPPSWIDSARSLAGRGVVVRFLARRAVVVRRDGWRSITSPPLVRLETTISHGPALLAVSGQAMLSGWVRKLLEPDPARPWCPPSGKAGPVVFTEGTTGILMHELVGHLLEGDLVAAGRSPFAGLGGANLTEAAIDLIDDPTRFDLPGAFDVDDEGFSSKPVFLLRSGQLCGLLCDRESGELCAVAPGRGRRSDWRHPPIPRLSNLIVPAGSTPAEQLEAGVRRGLVVTRLAGATVDPLSCRAVLRVERGFELHNGRRRRPLGPFQLTGGVTEILAGIDPTVGDDPTPDWRLGWCVKDAAPLPTGSEAPTILIRRLEVL